MKVDFIEKEDYVYHQQNTNLTLSKAHCQLFKRLDKIDLNSPGNVLRTLCTRFALWGDMLELVLDEVRICLHLLKEETNFV